MADGSHKISPRKFSEKIALHLRKQEESNANFHAIIKSVQSTKSHHQNSVGRIEAAGRVNHSADLKKSSREESGEAFYRDLECATQFVNTPQLYECTDLDPETTCPNGCPLAELSPQVEYQQSGHYAPLNSIPTNIPDEFPRCSLGLHCNPPDHAARDQSDRLAPDCCDDQSTEHAIRRNNLYGELENSQPNQELASGQSAMRTRVTSVGSAHCNKYLAFNGQPAKNDYAQQPDQWQNDSGIYLKEPSERSRQKSSSDPALHVPQLPFTSSGFTSENTLAGAQSQRQIVAPSYSPDDSSQNQQIQSGLYLSDGDTNASFQGTYTPGSCQLIAMDVPCDGADLHGDLPGIKICTFDEDGDQQFANMTAAVSGSREDLSNEGSLPDISNLQFSVSPDIDCTQSSTFCQSVPIGTSATSCGNQVALNRLVEGEVHFSDNGFDNLLDSNECTGGVPLDSSGWPIMSQLKEVNNNNLSHSTGGLPQTIHNGASPNAPGAYDSIIRSHSHTSIDHLTRPKMSTSHHVNHRVGPYPQQYHHHIVANHHRGNQTQKQLIRQQPSAYQTNHFQRQPQLHQQMYAFGPPCNQLARCYSSNSSIRPQRGSVSPLGSSSNLASPQSEQNSPGESCGSGQQSAYESQSEQQRVAATTCPFEPALEGSFCQQPMISAATSARYLPAETQAATANQQPPDAGYQRQVSNRQDYLLGLQADPSGAAVLMTNSERMELAPRAPISAGASGCGANITHSVHGLASQAGGAPTTTTTCTSISSFPQAQFEEFESSGGAANNNSLTTS